MANDSKFRRLEIAFHNNKNKQRKCTMETTKMSGWKCACLLALKIVAVPCRGLKSIAEF